MPGWERECNESNTKRQRVAGTNGRFASVDVSQIMAMPAVESGTSASLREEDEGVFRRRVSSEL